MSKTPTDRTWVAPRLPEKCEYPLAGREQVKTEARLDELIVAKLDLSEEQRQGMSFCDCLLKAVTARAADWRGLRLTDVRLEQCHMDNSLWYEAVLERVEILSSRLTGLSAAQLKAGNTRFHNCQADYASFAEAKLASCRFEQCSLKQADFRRADLRGAVMTGCDLREADLTGARLQDADLRGSQLAGLRAESGDLRGMIIDAAQLLDLAGVLGLEVRPRADE